MGVRGCGPKPKSTEQHKSDGTYRKDRHAERVELGGTSPEMPEGLGEHGQRTWGRIVRRLPRKKLDELDTDKLTILCITRDKIETASSVSEFLKLAAMFDRYGRQFGMSPMDRDSMSTEPEQSENPLELFRKAFKG